jgi:hypothetical protein
MHTGSGDGAKTRHAISAASPTAKIRMTCFTASVCRGESRTAIGVFRDLAEGLAERLVRCGATPCAACETINPPAIVTLALGIAGSWRTQEERDMSGWMPANPAAEATEALAQAMLRTGYVPTATKDEFHARVVAGVLIRELQTLGYQLVKAAATEGVERSH